MTLSTTLSVADAESRVLEAARELAAARATYQDLARRNASASDCRFALASRAWLENDLAEQADALRAADEAEAAEIAEMEAAAGGEVGAL